MKIGPSVWNVMNKIRHIPLLFFLCLSSGEIFAACELIFSDFPTQVEWRGDSGGYSPIESKVREEKVEIRVENIGDDDCKFWIAASRGQQSDASYLRTAFSESIGLNYWLNGKKNSSNRVLKDLPDTFDDDHVIKGKKLKPGKNEKKSYYLRVPSRQNVSAGRYTDRIDFKLFSGEPTGNPAPEDFQSIASVNFDFPVQKVISIGLGGSGRDITLDFGEMASNASIGFRMLVYANDEFRVNLKSDHAGVLEHSAGNDSVPYAFKEGSHEIDLTSGEWEEMVHEKKHKEGFKSYNCSITLGTVRRNQTEGDYEDVIYVDLIVD